MKNLLDQSSGASGVPLPVAAIDLASRNAAHDYLFGRKLDPWGRHCFRKIVETLVNHGETYFPAVNRRIDPSSHLSGLFGNLLALGELKLFEQRTAQEVEERVLKGTVDDAFNRYWELVIGQTSKVRNWCAFHVNHRLSFQYYINAQKGK